MFLAWERFLASPDGLSSTRCIAEGYTSFREAIRFMPTPRSQPGILILRRSQEQPLLSAGFQVRSVSTPRLAQVQQNFSCCTINNGVKGNEECFVLLKLKWGFLVNLTLFQKLRDLLARQNLHEEAYMGAAETRNASLGNKRYVVSLLSIAQPCSPSGKRVVRFFWSPCPD